MAYLQFTGTYEIEYLQKDLSRCEFGAVVEGAQVGLILSVTADSSQMRTQNSQELRTS